jgi:hypothetical protein
MAGQINAADRANAAMEFQQQQQMIALATQQKQQAAAAEGRALQNVALAQTIQSTATKQARDFQFQKQFSELAPKIGPANALRASANFLPPEVIVRMAETESRNQKIMDRGEYASARAAYAKSGINPFDETPNGPVVNPQKLQQSLQEGVFKEQIRSLDVKSRTTAQQMRAENPNIPVEEIIQKAPIVTREKEQLKEVLPKPDADILDGSETVLRQIDVLRAAMKGQDVTGVTFPISKYAARILGDKSLSQTAKIDQLYNILRRGEAFTTGGKALTSTELKQVTESIGSPSNKDFENRLEIFADETAERLYDRINKLKQQGLMVDPITGRDHVKFGGRLKYLEDIAVKSSGGLRDRIARQSGGETNQPSPASVPPPAQRKSGEVYATPRGDLKWTGTGWVKP